MESFNNIKMANPLNLWKNGEAKNITLSITEQCNLACKYCYMVGKNSNNKMSFDTAKKVVDYVLTDPKLNDVENVIWEFIGGEPFLEIDLINKICEYIKLKTTQLNHPWSENYMFSFTTNGLLYSTTKVQDFIKNNFGHVSICMSIDGNEIKHDLQRVYPDGSGSYKDVIKNVPLWLKQFPYQATKATFSHDDLPYLKDSIISLWDLGIKTVSANLVYEDVWKDGDEYIFEEQLKELADYVIENKLWNKYSVRFFDPSIGFKLEKQELKKQVCGAGKMLAVSSSGDFYPCIRFLDFALSNNIGYSIGNINTGIDENKLIPFKYLNIENQSSNECINCDVASGCTSCTGFNYDDNKTIFKRTTYNCKMHKANVRANNYFWGKLAEVTNGKIDRIQHYNSIKEKFMIIILSDDIEPHCSYENNKKSNRVMSESMLLEVLEFCILNNFQPILIGDLSNYDSKANLKQYINVTSSKYSDLNENNIIVYNNINEHIVKSLNYIVSINKNIIGEISLLIEKIISVSPNARLNIVIQDVELWSEDNFYDYEEQLKLISNINKKYKEIGYNLDINIISDEYNTEDSECSAGIDTFAFAPNGKLYICPGFYFEDEENYLGDLNEFKSLDELSYYKCTDCQSKCLKCKFKNKKITNEYSIPSMQQCRISRLQYKYLK